MVSQSTWNLLFSWITGKQCMLPEGCSVPTEGVIFYLAAAILLVALAKYGVPQAREWWNQRNE